MLLARCRITFPGMKPSLPPWPSLCGCLVALTAISREGCQSTTCRETCGSSAQPAHSSRQHSPSGGSQPRGQEKAQGWEAGRQHCGPSSAAVTRVRKSLDQFPLSFWEVGYQTLTQELSTSLLCPTLTCSVCHHMHKEGQVF